MNRIASWCVALGATLVLTAPAGATPTGTVSAGAASTGATPAGLSAVFNAPDWINGRLDSTEVAGKVVVHAPETSFERDRGNVVRELARQGVVWPVALDNSFHVWNALANEYWPTQYIFDRHGALRKTVVGEGQDAVVDSTVQALIAEH
jgi:hypothetical protein